MTTTFASISEIISQSTQPTITQHIQFYKDARIAAAAAPATVAGNITSLFRYNGSPSSGANVIPGAAAVLGRISTGSLFQNDPTTGKLWCMGAVANSIAAGTLIIYDRLTEMAGLSGIVTTPQLVSCSSTRYTGSNVAGALIYVEIYTAIGATQVNINATYINQSGITSITPSASIGATGLNESSRIIGLPLAPGDTGAAVVNSIILSATTAATGSFGIFIGRPLLVIPISLVGVASVKDTLNGLPTMPQVEANACLAMMWVANGVTAPRINGSLHLIEK
jgi:hypothetical protein